MTAKNKVLGVMFVCLGNICRSPMAEAVFQHLVHEKSLSEYFHIESAGVGPWHIGEHPHSGTRDVLEKYKMPLNPAKRGQQIQADLFTKFDYVIAMDRSNQDDLLQYGHADLLLENVPGVSTSDVPDPYYDHNFDLVYQLVLKGCTFLLERICREQKLSC
jgi:protein-tyrosine phosphatase